MGTSERLAMSMVGDDLGWSDHSTKSIEYVAAMSAATSLGSDIFRSKDKDPSAMRRAVRMLTEKSIIYSKRRKQKVTSALAQAMSVTALIERIHPHCRQCNGAEVVIIGELKVVCPTCEGIGVHRFSDAERARLCGIQKTEWPKWERIYRMVLGIAMKHDIAPLMAGQRLR